ncbi:MAG TPA: hypothetical protein VIC71_13175 [Gammaproteobacteria bacterium]
MEPLGAATARAEFEVPPTPHAPLFRTLIERIDATRRIVVLDLGAAHAKTLELFSRFRCRIEIVDARNEIESLNGSADSRDLEAAVTALLPRVGPDPLDIALCWDLLNYLDRRALAALMAALAGRTAPGGLAHALIVYRESRMPARPGDYVPLQDFRLLNLGQSLAERAAPRYSPEDLKLCMPGFAIERGRLLGNGMQEFLFRRKAPLEENNDPRARTNAPRVKSKAS